MNGIQKVVDELEAFEQSIRHLPLTERKRLREREYQRRSKASETGRKIAYVGAVAFIPAVVWSGLCFYTDTVLGFRAHFLQKSHLSHKKHYLSCCYCFIRTPCHLHRLVDLLPPEDCPDL